jgi:GntR family transcriptional regulator, transcriptional repressor for pyruvate dehydrogenase complex
MQRQTVVDEVVDRLALKIAAGSYAPGELLPSVRQLAADHAINRTTAQLVLSRLETAGFVEARRNIGFLVRDIRLFGGTAVWHHLFRFSRQLPDTATKIFADILEVDEILLNRAVRTIAEQPRQYEVAATRRAVDRLELLAGTSPVDLGEVIRAELHALRTVMAAVDQVMFLALFNSAGEMLIGVPEVVEAFYVLEPVRHVEVWRTFVAGWEKGEPFDRSLGAYEAHSDQYYAAVVERFHELVTR